MKDTYKQKQIFCDIPSYCTTYIIDAMG